MRLPRGVCYIAVAVVGVVRRGGDIVTGDAICACVLCICRRRVSPRQRVRPIDLALIVGAVAVHDIIVALVIWATENCQHVELITVMARLLIT